MEQDIYFSIIFFILTQLQKNIYKNNQMDIENNQMDIENNQMDIDNNQMDIENNQMNIEIENNNNIIIFFNLLINDPTKYTFRSASVYSITIEIRDYIIQNYISYSLIDTIGGGFFTTWYIFRNYNKYYLIIKTNNKWQWKECNLSQFIINN